MKGGEGEREGEREGGEGERGREGNVSYLLDFPFKLLLEMTPPLQS